MPTCKGGMFSRSSSLLMRGAQGCWVSLWSDILAIRGRFRQSPLEQPFIRQRMPMPAWCLAPLQQDPRISLLITMLLYLPVALRYWQLQHPTPAVASLSKICHQMALSACSHPYLQPVQPHWFVILPESAPMDLVCNRHLLMMVYK